MSRKTETKKLVPQETIDIAIAKAVADGDIVNFRFLFLPYSPLREDSTEDINTIKYSYLLPSEEEENSPKFKSALELVKRPDIREHINRQLHKKGPPQLPSELILMLADNAVSQGKYTSASQAYELLRIRIKIQELFFQQGDEELAKGNISNAVRAYRIASELEYDYGAFPEPLPAVPKYQEHALILHGEYKEKWEECIGYLPIQKFLTESFNYLFLRPEHANRILEKSIEIQTEFLVELIHQIDPNWSKFADNVSKTVPILQELYQEIKSRRERIAQGSLWEDEWVEGLDTEKFLEIPKILLGRKISPEEWWAYLKEIAYLHPASPLFLARQMISKEKEIILPRYNPENPVAIALSLPPLPQPI
ncbi:MAG: hypothetical protein N3G21_06130 [Candidatus Hydrogenedentes bacterium]|nr:hypothetical protein [Candidatus Hydrogenedentota bacterium]